MNSAWTEFLQNRPVAGSAVAGNGARTKAILLTSAIAMSLVLTAMAVLDPLLRERYPVLAVDIGWLPRGFPWLIVPSIIALATLCTFVWLFRGWLFERRYELTIILLMIPGAINGLHIGSLDSFDIVMVSIGAVWLAMTMVERRPLLTPTFILTLLLGIGAFAFASVINGRASTILGMPSMVNKLILVVILTNVIRTPHLLRTAVHAVIVVAAISSLIALVSEGIYYWSGYELTFDENEDFHYKEMPFGLMLRATALLAAPQALGHLLILAFMLTVMMPWRASVRMAIGLILLSGLAVTFSTGAYIAAGIAAVFWPAARRPSRAIHYFTALSACGLILYLTGGLKWLYATSNNMGSDAGNDRLDYLRVALNVIKHYPIIGIGLNNFNRALYIPVHNAYLQMAAEIGLLGGLLFAVLVGSLFVRSIICARFEVDADQKLYLKGLALGMLAMIIQFFIEPLYRNVVSWAFMGIVASATSLHWPNGKSHRGKDENEFQTIQN